MKYKKWEELTRKEKITGTIVLLGIIIFAFSLFSGSGDQGGSQNTSSTITASPTPSRDAIIEKQFSLWDGSHRQLTRHIKEAMNDPKSYEHVETTYRDMQDYIIVTTQFRGKNAFGGTVLDSITAHITLDGEIINILE